MQRVKVLALAIMGVCVLSVAITASASAHLFHASETGLLLGVQTGNQEFKTGTFGSVICKKAVTHGVVSALLALHQLVTTNYSECKAFSTFNAEVSPAQYLFNADEGLVKIENTIIITVKSLACFVTVPSGQDLKEITYDNETSAGAILQLSKVTGIESYSSVPSACGGTSKEGTYTGNNLITLDGAGKLGFISWL